MREKTKRADDKRTTNKFTTPIWKDISSVGPQTEAPCPQEGIISCFIKGKWSIRGKGVIDETSLFSSKAGSHQKVVSPTENKLIIKRLMAEALRWLSLINRTAKSAIQGKASAQR